MDGSPQFVNSYTTPAAPSTSKTHGHHHHIAAMIDVLWKMSDAYFLRTRIPQSIMSDCTYMLQMLSKIAELIVFELSPPPPYVRSFSTCPLSPLFLTPRPPLLSLLTPVPLHLV